MANLFQEATVGELQLSHRIVYAPLTRLRNSAQGVPPPEAIEHYAQRASTPGTLLISEGAAVAHKAGGAPNAPGIWSEEQITSWKKITDAVHAKGSFIYIQIAGLGRGAIPEVLNSMDPPAPYVAPSALKLPTRSSTPRELTKEEIQEYVQLFATAATNAVHKAGFDGVEIHGANGYLIDEFVSDVSNVRTDEYGGSIENRCRFTFEILDAVTKVIGANKTGYRVSPWSTFQDVRMKTPQLKETYTYLVSQLKERYPDFAYLHAVEPRIGGDHETEPISEGEEEESNDFMRDIWAPKPFISAGGHSRQTAVDFVTSAPNQLVAFGRHFLANPDLPRRFKEDIPLNKYDRSTFYGPGELLTKGYTDYPFAPIVQVAA